MHITAHHTVSSIIIGGDNNCDVEVTVVDIAELYQDGAHSPGWVTEHYVCIYCSFIEILFTVVVVFMNRGLCGNENYLSGGEQMNKIVWFSLLKSVLFM